MIVKDYSLIERFNFYTYMAVSEKKTTLKIHAIA